LISFEGNNGDLVLTFYKSQITYNYAS